MPQFSTTSARNLMSCHQDLQTLFNYVIKHFDCTIIYGHRSQEKQWELYKIGREKRPSGWVKTGNVVTYKDGYTNKSKHNYSPSLAVDVVPYPIDWNNTDRMRFFIGHVLGWAQALKAYGGIDSTIISGIDWDNDTKIRDTRFNDFPHFEIR